MRVYVCVSICIYIYIYVKKVCERCEVMEKGKGNGGFPPERKVKKQQGKGKYTRKMSCTVGDFEKILFFSSFYFLLFLLFFCASRVQRERTLRPCFPDWFRANYTEQTRSLSNLVLLSSLVCVCICVYLCVKKHYFLDRAKRQFSYATNARDKVT